MASSADTQPASLIPLACPICHASLNFTAPDRAECQGAAAHRWQSVAGVWHFLRREREAYFARFMSEYETIRRAKGRGSDGPDYYRALPYRDLSGRMSADWQVRARSFDTLVAQVVEPLESRLGMPLIVLDLGAGNGWLSNRLAERGHHRSLRAVPCQASNEMV